MLKRSDKILAGLAVMVLVLPTLLDESLAIQPTISLARGLYLKSSINRELMYGDIVSVSFKDEDIAKRPGTYPFPKSLPWHTFIKVIYGLPGDIINISDEEFYINGKYIGPVFKKDSKGRPLTRTINGEYQLQEGWYFISTSHPKSYGSQYMGPVHVSQMKLATPLWLLPWDKTFEKGKLFMDRENARQALDATMKASGVLKYIMRKNVTDIHVNPDGKLWIDELGKGRKFTGKVIPSAMVEAVLRTAASYVGDVITLDRAHLAADLECYNFARLQGSIYPATSAPQFAIRKKAILNYSLDELCEKKNMLTSEQVEIIKNIIMTGKHILVSGSTGCGKTTFLNAMLKKMKNDRVIILEKERELDTSCLEDTVAMRATDDTDSMKRLVRAALRLNPDRIIIGEIMGAEAYSLMQCNRTGHNGSVSSIHAESPKQAMNQLEDYINESHLNNVSQNRVAETVDIIVQIKKNLITNERTVTEIAKVIGFDGNEYVVETIG